MARPEALSRSPSTSSVAPADTLVARDASTPQLSSAQTSEKTNPSDLKRSSSFQLRLDAIMRASQCEDVSALRLLARQGLENDEARRIAWPILLGKLSADLFQDWRSLPRHRDEDQVKLDVDRSFIYYPRNQSSKDLSRRKEELSNLITQVLRQNRFLCYFQGYHDICQVFLLVLGPEAAASAVTRLSIFRIRDFMLPSMNPSLFHLRLLPELIYLADQKLALHLSLTQPFFALAATITLYAHEIQEYGDIARLFDAFLSRAAIFPVYLFAQIVLTRRDELLEYPADEPEILYSILSKLPKPLNLDSLLDQTDDLYSSHPPQTLRGWRKISRSSVLKASLDSLTNDSIENAKAAFKKQVAETKRAERLEKLKQMLWKFRRPARSVALAALVGVLSWYLGRRGYIEWNLARDSIFSTLARKFGFM
ncbi:MAG: hypothetical protein M1814_001028 [Vezdaea aestivalis]|nr:MAG: hypothetical protein M1814_001028 [Vezdaea aestivalis]